MCLGVPGKLVETYVEEDVPMGKVDFGGVSRRVCLAHVPSAQPGEYVLVHVGFALTRIDEEEAARVFALLKELDMLEGELATDADADAGADADAAVDPAVPADAGGPPS